MRATDIAKVATAKSGGPARTMTRGKRSPEIMPVRPTLGRRATAEALGTGLLVAAVVGSGIMGERLAGGNVGLALLANTAATGAALVALILALGPVSGAHFNPVVTLAASVTGAMPGRDVPAYVAAQALGGVLGAALANLMFGGPIFSLAQHARHGPAQLLSEVVATFGLLLVIGLGVRHRPAAVPFAVAAYITAAYWFTASTSFANPAVTLARALSDSFAGIRPQDVPGFVVAQCVGGALAIGVVRWLLIPPAGGPEPE